MRPICLGPCTMTVEIEMVALGGMDKGRCPKVSLLMKKKMVLKIHGRKSGFSVAANKGCPDPCLDL